MMTYHSNRGEYKLMTNINEDTLNSLLAWRTYKTNVHLVANQLKISDEDASMELLNKLLSSRFRKYTASQLSELVKSHDVNLGWSISYCRMDLISSHFKQLGKRAELEHSAELEDVETGIAKVIEDNGNEVEISEFRLQQAISLFPTVKSQRFVELALRYGKVETRALLHLSNKQYSDRLRNATKYVTAHHSKFDLINNERNSKLYVLNSLNELEAIINETQTGSVQTWLNGHVKLTHSILADSGVRFQGAVLNHWETADNKDKYAFIRQTIKEQAKAKQWLDESNEMIRQAGEAQSN